MNPTEQKIREFAADILNWADPHNSKHQQNLDGAVEIYKKHFGQPEQPDKSLDEIAQKYHSEFSQEWWYGLNDKQRGQKDYLEIFTKAELVRNKFKQACIEYAATKGAK